MSQLENNTENIIEALRTKVVRAYNEYKDYIDLVKEENKKKRESLSKIKENYTKDSDDNEIVDFSFQIFMIDALHRRDIEILGTKFVNFMRLFKEIPETIELDEEIEKTFELIKNNTKEQSFVVEKGKFQEMRKGIIEEQKKFFNDNDLFDKLRGELEKML